MDKDYVVFGYFVFHQGRPYFEYGRRGSMAQVKVCPRAVPFLMALKAVEEVADGEGHLQHLLDAAFEAGRDYERNRS